MALMELGDKIQNRKYEDYVLKNMKEFNPSVFVSVPLILETVHKRIMKAIHAKPHGEQLFKVGKVLCKAGSYVGLDLKKKFFGEIQEPSAAQCASSSAAPHR